MVVEMIMVGGIGTKIICKQVFSALSVFLMPSCSGSGIYVVLMIEVSYVVMVAYPHWRVIIVVLVGRNNKLTTTVHQFK